MDGREQKVGFAEKKLRLWHIGLYRVRRQVGEFPFWVFYVAIRWRRWVGADFFCFVRIWTKIGRFCGSKANMKHLKHSKHLKHLKHFLWMFGLLFCKYFKELGDKVKDGVQ